MYHHQLASSARIPINWHLWQVKRMDSLYVSRIYQPWTHYLTSIYGVVSGICGILDAAFHKFWSREREGPSIGRTTGRRNCVSRPLTANWMTGQQFGVSKSETYFCLNFYLPSQWRSHVVTPWKASWCHFVRPSVAHTQRLQQTGGTKRHCGYHPGEGLQSCNHPSLEIRKRQLVVASKL